MSAFCFRKIILAFVKGMDWRADRMESRAPVRLLLQESRKEGDKSLN